MNEKGQLESLRSVVIALVIIGLILGVGFMLLEEFQSELSENKVTINNETVDLTPYGYAYVTKNSTTAGIICYNGFEVIIVTNASNGIIVSSGNYTYDDDGKITNLTYVASEWNVTYSYQYGKEACGGITDTITATQKVPTWLSVIVIVLIAGILLVIVFKVLPVGRGSRGGEIAEI